MTTASTPRTTSSAGIGSGTSGFGTWLGVSSIGGLGARVVEHRVDEQAAAVDLDQERGVSDERQPHAAMVSGRTDSGRGLHTSR